MLKKENSYSKDAKPIKIKSKKQINVVKIEKNKQKVKYSKSNVHNTSPFIPTAGSNYETIERQLVLTYSDNTTEYRYVKTYTALNFFLKTISESEKNTEESNSDNIAKPHITGINIEPKIKKKLIEVEQNDEEGEIDNFVQKKIDEALFQYELLRNKTTNIGKNSVELERKKLSIIDRNQKENLKNLRLRPKNTYTERNFSKELSLTSVSNIHLHHTKQSQIKKEAKSTNMLAQTSESDALKLEKCSFFNRKIKKDKLITRMPAYLKPDKERKKPVNDTTINECGFSFADSFKFITLIINTFLSVFCVTYYFLIFYTSYYILYMCYLCLTIFSFATICYLYFILKKKHLGDTFSNVTNTIFLLFHVTVLSNRDLFLVKDIIP